jgi:hypothetical protein
MKTRTTLLMTLLAGGLFAYLWFVERHEETTRDASESSSKVVSVERDKIESFSIRNGPVQIELQKKEGVWQMEHPLQDRADASAIDRLIGILEGLRHDARIELPKGKEQETLKEFGIADSENVLKFKTTGGKETQLLLGKDSAVAGKLYIRQQGHNSVFVIRNELRDRITAGPDEFRDHRLTATPASSVERFTIQSGGAEITLERKSGDWELLKPMRARAATSRVNDLLAALLTAPVSQFLPETPTPDQGLAEPRATITAALEGQKDALVLHVGATPGGEEHKDRSFAKISGRHAVTILPNAALDPLLKARPNDLRDKKLLRVEPDIIDRITLEPQGKPPLVLMRKGEGWIFRNLDKEAPVKDGLAQRLLSEMLAADAVEFVADLTSDLGKFGLKEPALRVRFSSFASENTAESKSGENPIVTLLFGKVEGENCFVKLEEEPFIVSASKRLFESLPSDVFDLLAPPAPARVLALAPAEVSAISSEGGGLPAVSIQKTDGVWKPTTGSAALDVPAIEGLLKELETMKAGKVTGQYAPLVRALETPTLTLKITTKGASGQKQQVLKVGAALKDGVQPATLDGEEGVFLLAPRDVAALRVNLVP